jgi:PKD repeat protein
MRSLLNTLTILLILGGYASWGQNIQQSAAMAPPVLTNASVFPSTGIRGDGTLFRYTVTYQDPDGDAPDVRTIYINGTAFTMQIASTGSYLSGKELYYELSVDSPTLLDGSNTFYFQVTDGNPANLVRLPVSGTWGGPQVTAPLNADFIASPTSGHAPLLVQFQNRSSGPILGYSWDFGDAAGGAINTNPSHTYTKSGSFTVTLRVYNSFNSDTEIKTNYIVVNGNVPIADFTGTPTIGNKPLTVQFTDLSTGDITSWSWTFGDGGTSTEQNPSYTYVNKGNYSVWLTVDGPSGTHSKGRPLYITVNDPTSNPPVANFTAFPTSGAKPLTVQFTNTSTGDITSYMWIFGDGGTSYLASPSHTYVNTGLYSVSLIASGPGGSDTKTSNNYINVTETSSQPVANFTATPTSGAKPLTVQFTDMSTGDITTRYWDFGDGGSSTSVNPGHTYSNAGLYSVSLTVNGPGGSNSKAVTNYITVTNSTTNPPVANFTASPKSGAKPLAVQFTDQSTGDITSRSWDFGDGGSSNAVNPGHTYSNAGLYSVSLTVNGPGGNHTKAITNYITVTNPTSNPPVANFSGTPTSGVKPLTVQFTDHSTGDITSRHWDFGDGGSSTGTNPSHVYADTGTFTVGLSVSGPGGSHSKSIVDYITVITAGTLVSNFWASPLEGPVPLTVEFVNKSVGTVNSQIWDFGDSSTSTQKNPFHTYQTTGYFSVSLMVQGPAGSHTKSRPNFIYVSPSSQVDTKLSDVTPGGYELNQNYPNPFNAVTIIPFYLPEAQQVSMSILNIKGETVAVLLQDRMSSGFHAVTWDGTQAPSDIYFIKMKAGNFTKMVKCLLLK